MEIIAHQINSINQLKKLNHNFGVEVDIRTNNNELVIGYGLYFYGTGGFSSGLDMSISF